MYKLLLISKYLRRKLAPLFAAVAVMLCTMMVIIVMSVMGGFLELLREAAHRLEGDVIVWAGEFASFAHYDQLAAELEALPEIAQATPVIRTFGQLQFEGGEREIVQVIGVRPAEYDAVVGYRESLYWNNDHVLDLYRQGGGLTAEQLSAFAERLDQESLTEAGMSLKPAPWMNLGRDPVDEGIVLGIEVYPWNRRGPAGDYFLGSSPLTGRVRLFLLPMPESGDMTQVEMDFRQPLLTVVNEFKSGLYDADAQRAYVGFDALQRWLMMQEVRRAGEEWFTEGEGTVPGRASELLVKAAPGVSADAARDRVEPIVTAFADRHAIPWLWTETWEQRHEQLLSAVENEKGMVSFLFIVISGVAVVMVATTFYMIVLEKTRDIGVLRAIGASRLGILGLFLGYGLAIGTVGAGLGFALGAATVHNLNEIQLFLGTFLGVTALIVGSALAGALIGAVGGVTIGFVRQNMGWWVARLTPLCTLALLLPAVGLVLLSEAWRTWLNETIRFVMWNPQTYYFDRIPSEINYTEAGLVVAGAILSSVVGAVIPALIAASRDPVEALRYE